MQKMVSEKTRRKCSPGTENIYEFNVQPGPTKMMLESAAMTTLTRPTGLTGDNLTGLLLEWHEGDKAALDRLTPLVYDELRRIAHRYVQRERDGHTLQTTALVNEAYLRLAGQQKVDWQNRAHFFAVTAQVMRHILIDHARRRRYVKHGGDVRQIPIEDAAVMSMQRAE